ncbi:RAMP superfamily CRISPR-associated protein [Pelomicrobium methylotrophicum]|uniref:CRISPR type III-associated protein domain-containing protein n=1 Tax=Pelomicrobium methylotrophicum TaxID=2602750 RepID=A0A5C7EKD9_9PROT|nr:RAMP superfamily CRISPR-associated protein [Pelomicrobium methylotrophicum]TXF11483.1 hypothetical protein FR698_10270 [Pelomicrobium methylotrophicum]
MKMIERRYTVRFLTPAFLGDALQNARWRTPPFKHLLREWWRVAYAAEHGFRIRVPDMRREEGLLFGNAWLDGEYNKSKVRIRLETPNGVPTQAWIRGKQKGVAPLSTGLDTSYAWFGLAKRGGNLPDRTAIKADDKEGVRVLCAAYTDEMDGRMKEIMRLIDAFGLLGSRSRGGWGALHVEGIEPLGAQEIRRYARPLDQCLQHDWAMSLAVDNQGLCVWQSQSRFKSWSDAMRSVASLRKAVRTKLKNVERKDLRQALGFAGKGRMPSPLRWKIVPDSNGLFIRVFAMPHKLPADSGASMSDENLKLAWKTVCKALDTAGALQRVS